MRGHSCSSSEARWPRRAARSSPRPRGSGSSRRALPSESSPGCSRSGVVQAVEPDLPIELLRATVDPLVQHEYWRPLVGADAATPPGPGKPITVIDTGLDLTHEEFAGRPNTILLGPQNLAESSEDFHGTAVSSVAAAPGERCRRRRRLPAGGAPLGRRRRSGRRERDRRAQRGDRRRPERDQHELRRSVHTPARGHAAEGVRHRLDPRRVVGERAPGKASPAGPPGSLPHVLTVAATDQFDDPADFSTPSLGVDLAAPWSRHPRRDSAHLQPERLRRRFPERASRRRSSRARPRGSGRLDRRWTRRRSSSSCA